MLKQPARLSQWLTEPALIRDGSFARLGNVTDPGPALLVYGDNRRALDSALANPDVTAAMVPPALAELVPAEWGLVVTDQPRTTYYTLVNRLAERGAFLPELREGRRGSHCSIHPSAQIEEPVVMGDRVTVGAGAIIHAGTQLGDDVSIGTGATLGCPGILHYVDAGHRYRVAHTGGVVVEDRTTVLSRAVLVQGIFPGRPTRVGSDCIVGIQSIVGHEAQVGDRAVISGNCVIARGAVLQPDTMLGTGCVVREYVQLGVGARAMAGSIVVESVPPGATVSGNFAQDHRTRMRQFALESRRERPRGAAP